MARACGRPPGGEWPWPTTGDQAARSYGFRGLTPAAAASPPGPRAEHLAETTGGCRAAQASVPHKPVFMASGVRVNGMLGEF